MSELLACLSEKATDKLIIQSSPVAQLARVTFTLQCAKGKVVVAAALLSKKREKPHAKVFDQIK